MKKELFSENNLVSVEALPIFLQEAIKNNTIFNCVDLLDNNPQFSKLFREIEKLNVIKSRSEYDSRSEEQIKKDEFCGNITETIMIFFGGAKYDDRKWRDCFIERNGTLVPIDVKSTAAKNVRIPKTLSDMSEKVRSSLAFRDLEELYLFVFYLDNTPEHLAGDFLFKKAYRRTDLPPV